VSRSERHWPLIFSVLLTGACSGPDLEVLRAEEPVSPDFLSAEQDQLWWRGEPYRFVGLNAFTLTGCGNDDERFDATRLDAFFASLRPHSLVRTYAFHSQALADIETVVDAAERHEHLLELVLADGNGSCSDEGARKSDAWYREDFRDDYLPWVREVTAHFRNRPSVGLWELVSSPSDVAPATLRAFYDEVGGMVHGLAPHQLVASGTHGAWAYGGGESYALIHESPGIDVAEFRDYDQEPGAPPNLAEAQNALAGAKPLILAEAGVFASPTGDPTQELEGRVCISWAQRSEVLASWFENALATPLSGILVWNYLPVARDACSYSTHESDPLFQAIHDATLP
jgi:hypothetical protein